MKHLNYLLLLTALACSTSTDNNNVSLQEQDVSSSSLDTIPERNDPSVLDLSRHQLFIDTTRNSKFYKELLTRVEALQKGFEVHNSIGIFPSIFISLRKYENDFVLYDRCDGADPIYVLNDSTFVIDGPNESIKGSIYNKQADDQTTSFEWSMSDSMSEDGFTSVRISKIDSMMYEIRHRNNSFNILDYATDVEGIKFFDMLVNHCPTSKVPEIDFIDK